MKDVLKPPDPCFGSRRDHADDGTWRHRPHVGRRRQKGDPGAQRPFQKQLCQENGIAGCGNLQSEFNAPVTTSDGEPVLRLVIEYVSGTCFKDSGGINSSMSLQTVGKRNDGVTYIRSNRDISQRLGRGSGDPALCRPRIAAGLQRSGPQRAQSVQDETLGSSRGRIAGRAAVARKWCRVPLAPSPRTCDERDWRPGVSCPDRGTVVCGGSSGRR